MHGGLSMVHTDTLIGFSLVGPIPLTLIYCEIQREIDPSKSVIAADFSNCLTITYVRLGYRFKFSKMKSLLIDHVIFH